MKQCIKCKVEKPVEQFNRNGRTRDGRNPNCKACHNAYMRDWWKRSPQGREKQRWALVERKFGLSREAHEKLLADQGGVCAICHKECSSNRNLAVDHDHASGRVRGLLCMRCNRAIGLLADDADLLRAAVSYLEREPVHA